MNKSFIAAATIALLLIAAPQLARAQYDPFSSSADALSPPLVTSSNQGAAPVPSTEIAPGAGNLLAPTTHVSPYDPIGSALDATTLSPYLDDRANSLAAGTVNTIVPDAESAVRASQSAFIAGPSAPESSVSSWETKAMDRRPRAASVAQPLPSAENANSGGTVSVASTLVSTWGPAKLTQSQPSASAWVAAGTAPPEPSRVAELRAISPAALTAAGSVPQMAQSTSVAVPHRGLSRQGTAISQGSYSVGPQPGKIGNFQDSTTGSAYLPQASSAGLPSSLASRLAAEPVDASPFRDLSTTTFLSPTLTAPLLSGNSLASGALEQRERGGLNGAEQRLQSQYDLHRSERSANRRRLTRDHRYINPILQQMEEQSSANQ